ncbi:MAG: serine protease [Candidatus Methylopumilus sp.]|nr:serine protease [Candidatus Methylopumilus sp.]
MYRLVFLFIFVSSSVFAFPSDDVTFAVNHAIVKVHVANNTGNHGVGSGIVVADNQVATNCHVVANAQGVQVSKFGVAFSPSSMKADWRHDLCILQFQYLDIKPVSLGDTQKLNYQQSVFSKSFGGNALKPIISFGNIKALYTLDHEKIIQSSAGFAMGASGGGLFDDEGRLLGLTTFKSPGRHAYYYSIPVEWIKTLLNKGKDIQLTAQTEAPFWDAPFEKRPFFMQTYDATREESWGRLKNIAVLWLNIEPESEEALFYDALASFELKDYVLAKKELNEVVKKNPRHAQAQLYLLKLAKLNYDKNEVSAIEIVLSQLDESLLKESQ